jgi:hypothetical protein
LEYFKFSERNIISVEAAKSSRVLEISVKSGKESTNTLSLVIHRLRFEKNLQKSTLTFKEGGPGVETQKTSNFDGSWVSPCLSFCLSGSTAATSIFTAPTCTTTIIPLEHCA